MNQISDGDAGSLELSLMPNQGEVGPLASRSTIRSWRDGSATEGSGNLAAIPVQDPAVDLPKPVAGQRLAPTRHIDQIWMRQKRLPRERPPEGVGVGLGEAFRGCLSIRFEYELRVFWSDFRAELQVCVPFVECLRCPEGC